MFGKFFAAASLVFGLCAAAAAGDVVYLSFNFWGSDGDIVPVGKLPEGVTADRKARFLDPKIYGYATSYLIDLDKVREIDLKFVVKGKKGTIKTSISPGRRPADGKKPLIECSLFEICDEPVAKAPCTFAKWTSMYTDGIEAGDGDEITVKAKFKSLTE